MSRSGGYSKPIPVIGTIGKPLTSNTNPKGADPSNRPKKFSPHIFAPVLSVDLAGDGKLGYGFTSADELEEIDIGHGDKPRPTFISKKLEPQSREPMVSLPR